MKRWLSFDKLSHQTRNFADTHFNFTCPDVYVNMSLYSNQCWSSQVSFSKPCLSVRTNKQLYRIKLRWQAVRMRQFVQKKHAFCWIGQNNCDEYSWHLSKALISHLVDWCFSVAPETTIDMEQRQFNKLVERWSRLFLCAEQCCCR